MTSNGRTIYVRPSSPLHGRPRTFVNRPRIFVHAGRLLDVHLTFCKTESIFSYAELNQYFRTIPLIVPSFIINVIGIVCFLFSRKNFGNNLSSCWNVSWPGTVISHFITNLVNLSLMGLIKKFLRQCPGNLRGEKLGKGKNAPKFFDQSIKASFLRLAFLTFKITF